MTINKIETGSLLSRRRVLLAGAQALVAASVVPAMAAADPQDAPLTPNAPPKLIGNTAMTFDLDTLNLKTIKTRIESGVLFAALDCPPINMIGPEMVRDLISLLDALEKDDAVKVVVFTSADKEYFISYVDIAQLAAGTQETGHIGGSASGSFGGLFRRLSEARQVTIAQVEGFARAAGSEFALACDMRFASKEHAVFGQLECALGTVPGAGALQHLTRLMGRGRAMEAVLSSGDYDADQAERYGWVNRALPQAELGPFVEALAFRIAQFPASGVTAAKKRINDFSLPPLADVRSDAALFDFTVAEPRTQTRTKELFSKGLTTRGDVDKNMAAALGDLKS